MMGVCGRQSGILIRTVHAGAGQTWVRTLSRLLLDSVALGKFQCVKDLICEMGIIMCTITS